MKKIGVLSDTHSYLSDEIYDFFKEVDEIWHCGDIGNVEILKKLSAVKPVRAVYGNIDGQEIRQLVPEHQRFTIEKVKVWITHIGGYPGRYDKRVKSLLIQNPPDLFVCGHSHILKVMYDDKLQMLHINPGAFGLSGFHKKRTAVRFIIDGKNFKDLEVLELPKFKNVKK